MNKVSVIVPNYNYARFLKRRLDSIAFQTVKPSEIVFLDDCSTDNSIEVAKELLPTYHIPYKIIANEVNQGVFKQWVKGIELVEHDLFWIAEADDYCELNFLETLLPAFDDEDVILSYCQSNYVLDDKVMRTHIDEINNHMDASRWKDSYVNNCLDEASNYLSAFSCIANASAVLLRKSTVPQNMISEIYKFQMAGDWYFFLQTLYSNPKKKINYVSLALNQWVQHTKSVWGDKNKVVTGVLQILQIYKSILEKYTVSDKGKDAIFNIISQYYIELENGERISEDLFQVVSLLNEKNKIKFLKKIIHDKITINTEISRLHSEICYRNNKIQQLTTNNHQLTTNNHQLSTNNHQLSTNNHQLTTELSTIHSSKGWRLLLLYYKISANLIPKGSIRRKTVVFFYNFNKSVLKLFWKSLKIGLRIIKIIVNVLRMLFFNPKELIKKIIIKIGKWFLSKPCLKKTLKKILMKYPTVYIKLKTIIEQDLAIVNLNVQAFPNDIEDLSSNAKKVYYRLERIFNINVNGDE